MILNIKELNAWFGDKRAVKDIDLVVQKNTIHAIIGPSGCGKSTFLRTLNRIHEEVPATRVEGIVELDGKNIYDSDVDPVGVRYRIGMVFQKPNPFPGMSIFENVTIGPKLTQKYSKRDLFEIAEESLRLAALWDEVKDSLDQPGISLSGGQQQRLCIARSLAVNPKVLLMDEPTSALDPIATKKIEDLCSELKKKVTVVVVTHNMQQAQRISDYTSFFVNGRLIETNFTNEIFSNPKEIKTKDYLEGKFG